MDRTNALRYKMFDIADISNYNIDMYLTYKPLWNTLKSRKMKKTDLCDIAGLSRSTLAKMGKEEYVALEVIERICKGLMCQVGDVIEVRQ